MDDNEYKIKTDRNYTARMLHHISNDIFALKLTCENALRVSEKNAMNSLIEKIKALAEKIEKQGHAH